MVNGDAWFLRYRIVSFSFCANLWYQIVEVYLFKTPFFHGWIHSIVSPISSQTRIGQHTQQQAVQVLDKAVK